MTAYNLIIIFFSCEGKISSRINLVLFEKVRKKLFDVCQFLLGKRVIEVRKER